MVRAPKSSSIKAIASQRADDYLWGMPESPEFSVVQRLINELKTHESGEEQCLSIYKKIAGESDDPLIRFLLNLIITDEQRHHEIISRMISGLKEDLASFPAAAPGKGRGGRRAGELLKMVERLLEVEQNGIKEYERLTKTSEGFHQDLFALLCRTMVHDSLKHIGILDFLRLKLREKQGAGRSPKR